MEKYTFALSPLNKQIKPTHEIDSAKYYLKYTSKTNYTFILHPLYFIIVVDSYFYFYHDKNI